MPKQPKFEPRQTAQGWMVSIPPTLSGNERRQRRFFETEQDAKKYAGKLRTQYATGQRGGVISHEMAVMAAKAAKILEPLGITILDAAKDALSRWDNPTRRGKGGERIPKNVQQF